MSAHIRARTMDLIAGCWRSSAVRRYVATGRLERTEREIDALYAAAGPARRRTVRTQSPFSVMVVAAG